MKSVVFPATLEEIQTQDSVLVEVLFHTNIANVDLTANFSTEDEGGLVKGKGEIDVFGVAGVGPGCRTRLCIGL